MLHGDFVFVCVCAQHFLWAQLHCLHIQGTVAVEPKYVSMYYNRDACREAAVIREATYAAAQKYC